MKNEVYYKKFILYLIILIVLILLFSFLYFFKTDDKKNNYYNFCEFDNEKVLETFLTASQIDNVKENIIKYLIDLEYTGDEINIVTFQDTNYSNDKNVYFYFLLDDEYKTLYSTFYDKDNKKINSDFDKYIWCGDKISNDFVNDVTKTSYLEIVNPDEYQQQQYLKDIEEGKADPNESAGTEYDYSN